MPAGPCAAWPWIKLARKGKRQVVVIEQAEVGRGRGQLGVVGDGFGKFGLTAGPPSSAPSRSIDGFGSRSAGTAGIASPLQSSACRRNIGVAPGRQHRRRQHAALEIARPRNSAASSALIGATLDTITTASSGGSCITRPASAAGGPSPARHHQVPQPRREPVAGVVALRAQLGGGAEVSEMRLAVRSSFVANVTRTWQLSRIEWFCPYALSIWLSFAR